jgi:ankyrin repeat protein
MIKKKLETLIDEFLTALEIAQAQNNIDPIKDILRQHQYYYSKPENSHLIKDYLSNALLHSVESGCLEAIDYLLTSKDLNQHSDVSTIESPLRIATRNGSLDIFQYFSNRFEKYYPQEKLDVAYFTLLGEASEQGKLNVVEFIINHPKIKNHKNFYKFELHAVQFSCMSGHLDIVQFFFPKDTKKQFEDNFLLNAIMSDHTDIVKYCIFDLNIPFSEHLNEAFMLYNDSKTSQARDFFNIRELNQALEKELSSATISQKKVKL